MTERRRSTLINAYGLNLFSKGADIAYFLVLVSVLTKNELGLFNELMSISLFFLTLLDFGISQAGLRGLSQGHVDVHEALHRAMPIRLLLLALTLLALGSGYFFGAIQSYSATALVLLAVYQTLSITHALILDGVRANDQQTAANVVTAAESCTKLLTLLAIKIGLPDIDAIDIISALLLIKILALTISYWLTRNFPRLHRFASQRSLFNPILFEGQWSLLIVALLTVVQNRLSWLLVSHFMNAETLATYSVVSRYFEIVLFALGIGFSTLYPWLCKAAQQDASRSDQRSLRILRQLQFLPVPIVVAAAIAVFPCIDTLFWGGRYADAIPANRWLLPCAGLAVGNMMMYYDLMANRKEHLLTLVCAAATLAQTAANFWAIPTLGVLGAVVGIWVMNSTNLIFYAIACRRNIYSSRELVLTVCAASAISGVILLAASYTSPLMLLAVFSLCTGAVVISIWRARHHLFASQVGIPA